MEGDRLADRWLTGWDELLSGHIQCRDEQWTFSAATAVVFKCIFTENKLTSTAWKNGSETAVQAIQGNTGKIRKTYASYYLWIYECSGAYFFFNKEEHPTLIVNFPQTNQDVSIERLLSCFNSKKAVNYLNRPFSFNLLNTRIKQIHPSVHCYSLHLWNNYTIIIGCSIFVLTSSFRFGRHQWEKF